MNGSLSHKLSKGYLNYAMGVLCLVNAVNYTDRMVLSIVVEPIKAELALSDTEIGLLTGFSFAIFYGLAGLFIAKLADVGDRRIILSVAIAIWSVMTALTGLAQNFLYLFLARIGVGIGEAGAIPTCNALISDYFPPEKRAASLAIFTSGATFGLTAGLWIGGYLAENYGWRLAFVAAALPGLPLALLVWMTIRETPRGVGTSGRASKREWLPAVLVLRELFNNLVYRYLLYAGSVVCFMLFGVTQWIPPLVIRRFGLSVADVGMQFGSAIGFGFASGAIVGGVVANRLAATNIRWLIRLPLLASLFFLPLCEFAIYAPTPLMTFLGIFLLNIVGGASFGPMLAAIQSVVAPTRRATAAAFFGFVTQVLGIGGMSFLIGVVSDSFAGALGNARSLQTALGGSAIIAIAGIFWFRLAAREFGMRAVY
jgi:predicted MFS family arabinose efflux permease